MDECQDIHWWQVCKPTITKTFTEYADNCVLKSSKTKFFGHLCNRYLFNIVIRRGLLNYWNCEGQFRAETLKGRHFDSPKNSFVRIVCFWRVFPESDSGHVCITTILWFHQLTTDRWMSGWFCVPCHCEYDSRNLTDYLQFFVLVYFQSCVRDKNNLQRITRTLLFHARKWLISIPKWNIFQ